MPAAPPVSAVRRVIARQRVTRRLLLAGVLPLQAFKGVVDGIELGHRVSSSAGFGTRALKSSRNTVPLLGAPLLSLTFVPVKANCER